MKIIAEGEPGHSTNHDDSDDKRGPIASELRKRLLSIVRIEDGSPSPKVQIQENMVSLDIKDILPTNLDSSQKNDSSQETNICVIKPIMTDFVLHDKVPCQKEFVSGQSGEEISLNGTTDVDVKDVKTAKTNVMQSNKNKLLFVKFNFQVPHKVREGKSKKAERDTSEKTGGDLQESSKEDPKEDPIVKKEKKTGEKSSKPRKRKFPDTNAEQDGQEVMPKKQKSEVKEKKSKKKKQKTEDDIAPPDETQKEPKLKKKRQRKKDESGAEEVSRPKKPKVKKHKGEEVEFKGESKPDKAKKKKVPTATLR